MFCFYYLDVVFLIEFGCYVMFGDLVIVGVKFSYDFEKSKLNLYEF